MLQMSEKRGVHIFVMHSWTKIWSCTGVQICSVVAPMPTHMVELKKRQVSAGVMSVCELVLLAGVRVRTNVRCRGRKDVGLGWGLVHASWLELRVQSLHPPASCRCLGLSTLLCWPR